MRDPILVKTLVNNYEEYIELIESLFKEFYSVEEFENHYEMTPYPEDTKEWEDGEYQLNTVRHKPDSYPCIYIWLDNINGIVDDFIYLRDFT